MKTNKNNIFRKWMTIAIICLFVGVSVLPSISSFKSVFGEGSFSTTLYVGGTGPGNYTSIQSAINDATSGDTVFVYSGTYYENIVIDVSINLIGENRGNTYIDGSASGDVVQISADYVDVMEFSIGNSGSGGYDAGIEITSSNNVITYCKIYLNYGDGIRLSSSSGNTISNCDVFSNGVVVYRKGIVLLSQSNNNLITNCGVWDNNEGIDIDHSDDNDVTNCNIYSNIYRGIYIDVGSNDNLVQNCDILNNGWAIYLYDSDNTVNDCSISGNDYGICIHGSYNDIYDCSISGNDYGISIYSSYNNIYDCSISGNDYGIYAYSSYHDNHIYHNDFSGNAVYQAYDSGSNVWDDGYPSGGNYWDDYTGTDEDEDGIGDIPYPIYGGDNEDRYPLGYFQENQPPNIPSNPNPPNDATEIDVNADLSWTGGDPDSGDTVTYDVYFGTASNPPNVVMGQSSTTYDPGTLDYDTKYYWRIDAWDNHGASTTGYTWNFQTVTGGNNPPYVPSNPIPSNGATGVDLNADLSWTGGDPDSGDTVTYDVYFGTASNPPNVVMGQSSTTYDPGTLDYDTKYYWRIDAWDNHGASTTGYTWNFQTVTGGNNPPYVPSNPVPSNGATGVDLNADLSWTGGDPDSGDTVTYDVYFGTASNPPNVVMGQSSTTYDPGTLDYDTKYYWRIDAWDNHGASTTGYTWNFQTVTGGNNPPYVPSDPNPSDAATNVNINVDLSWTGGDPDSGDTVTYDVYFGTASNPPNVATSQFGTLYDPGTLDNNTQYYWRVVAWDNHGVSNAGSVWTFRTVSPTNNPPNKPTISGLTSGKAGIEYEYTFVTTDPDGDNVYYYIEWGDGNIDGTSWIGPYESGEEIKINHSWSKKGTYLITAKAKDSNDAESDYATLEVTMPKSKTINQLMLFIERLINRFPFLEKILQQFN